MALSVAVEVRVTVNGASHNYGAHNIFADVEDARGAKLHEGVARGVAAKLEALYAAHDAPQMEAAQEVATESLPEPEPAVADATVTPSQGDAEALAHAERLRNELRASRAASVETAATDERAEREA